MVRGSQLSVATMEAGPGSLLYQKEGSITTVMHSLHLLFYLIWVKETWNVKAEKAKGVCVWGKPKMKLEPCYANRHK